MRAPGHTDSRIACQQVTLGAWPRTATFGLIRWRFPATHCRPAFDELLSYFRYILNVISLMREETLMFLAHLMLGWLTGAAASVSVMVSTESGFAFALAAFFVTSTLTCLGSAAIELRREDFTDFMG